MSSKAKEALLAVYDCAKDGVLAIRESAFEKVVEALTEPLRNSEVGTAEEQVERYMNFCHNFPKCTGCPCVGLVKYNKCEFAWLQMPYKSEVSNETIKA